MEVTFTISEMKQNYREALAKAEDLKKTVMNYRVDTEDWWIWESKRRFWAFEAASWLGEMRRNGVRV